MEIWSEFDGFQVQKSGRPGSLAGVMKEAIQRDKVMRAVQACTDENMGMHGIWSLGQRHGDVWGYSMSWTKAQACVGRCGHVQLWTDGVDKGQGQGLMTSEFEHGTKFPGISEILCK